MGVLIAWRGGAAASLAGYFFVVSCIARGMIGGLGWTPGALVQVLIGTALMVTFVVWLAPTIELPEVWYQHRTPAKRLARGLCPECGHAMPTLEPRPVRCTECGASQVLRPPWEFGARTIKRFAVLALAAYVVGCGIAMWWIASDESRFRREAALAAGASERSRVWPASFARLIADEDGTLRAPGVVTEGEIDPNWTPKSR